MAEARAALSAARETADAMADLLWLSQHGAQLGVTAVIAERRRQIEKLGYTIGHDRAIGEPGWLAKEATLRAAGATMMIRYDPPGNADSRHELAEVGALAAAEIDRLAAP